MFLGVSDISRSSFWGHRDALPRCYTCRISHAVSKKNSRFSNNFVLVSRLSRVWSMGRTNWQGGGSPALWMRISGLSWTFSVFQSHIINAFLDCNAWSLTCEEEIIWDMNFKYLHSNFLGLLTKHVAYIREQDIKDSEKISSLFLRTRLATTKNRIETKSDRWSRRSFICNQLAPWRKGATEPITQRDLARSTFISPSVRPPLQTGNEKAGEVPIEVEGPDYVTSILVANQSHKFHDFCAYFAA